MGYVFALGRLDEALARGTSKTNGAETCRTMAPRIAVPAGDLVQDCRVVGDDRDRHVVVAFGR